MNKSEQINEIAAALAKAQGEIGPAVFDRMNPHFKSKYATLTSIAEAVRGPLAKNGLAYVQRLAGERGALRVETTLVHSSGQWIADDGVPLLLDKDNMQGLGSAFTYAKRFGLSALLGVVSDEDDDGEQASHPATPLPSGNPAAAIAAQLSSASSEAPVCCGKPMFVSKYSYKEFGAVPPWYCGVCKKKEARAA